MNIKNRIVSKLSTLDAGRTIFFIIVGLAIKESLDLFSTSSKHSELKSVARLVIAVGFLITAIRFSHGTAMLHGHERERISATNLPTSLRIGGFSLSMFFSSIFLYLMAINIGDFTQYLRYFFLFVVINTFLLWISKTVRDPFNWRWRSSMKKDAKLPRRIYITFNFFRRIRKRIKNTADGYLPRSALNWIICNFILILIFFFFYVLALSLNKYFYPSELYDFKNWLNTYPNAYFGIILIAFGVLDYWQNWAFYFGDADELRKNKFVFVCSPFTGTTKEMTENVKLAQFYCSEIMKDTKRKLEKIIEKREARGKSTNLPPGERSFLKNFNIPFASHCFFPYFLGLNQREITISRECSLAYMRACDAVYFYSYREGEKDSNFYSEGMTHKLEEAQEMGIEIRTRRKEAAVSADFKVPDWRPFDEQVLAKLDTVFFSENNKKETYFDGSKLRKRVYVCTHLRGHGFADKTLEEKKAHMQENVRRSLWYCRMLAKNEKEWVAPFAPQAFFPYFWDFLDQYGRVDEINWNVWFDSSIRLLRICDAIYVYTEDGLPNSKGLSKGMNIMVELAKKCGIEIRYVLEEEPPVEWQPVLPEFRTIS